MRVAVHGYLDAAVGVGEAARRGILGLVSRGDEVDARTIALAGRDLVSPRTEVGAQTASSVGGRVDAELLYVNPERLGELVEEIGPRREGVRRVGIWSWECDVVPRGWIAASCELDEVWTYSRVSAGILGAALTVPVVDMPIPVICAAPLPAPELPLSEGPRFICVFDHLSTLERKNPLGAIEAFTRAFADGEGPQLVVKTIGARHRPEAHRRLLEAAGRRRDVVVFDGVIDAGALVGLLQSSAGLVSLHRSEGFGLLPAEAAMLGVPVIATGFGGVLDFLDDRSAWLVDHAVVEVGEGVEHYPASGTWAEPDPDHAAAGLREIVEHPGAAAVRATRAQARVAEQFGVEAIGRRMHDRLRTATSSARRADFGRTRTREDAARVIVGVPFCGEHDLGPTLRALEERTPVDVPIVVACGRRDLEAAKAAQSPSGIGRVELAVADRTVMPWPDLLAMLASAGSGGLALVAPGVAVAEGWLEGLVSVADDQAVASSSALVVDATGGGRTARLRGDAAAAPAGAAAPGRGGASGARPELPFASCRCALLRRPALDLLRDLDPRWWEPGQVLGDFGSLAVAGGLRNVVADEVLVADSRPRLRGFWPPDEEPEPRSPGAPAVPGPIRGLGGPDFDRSRIGSVGARRRNFPPASPRTARVAVLLGYYVLAVLTIGRHAIGHPTTVCACVGTGDPAFYTWALGWWPYAILHAYNPFFTHAVWATTGANVVQSASIPTAAILMAPITLIAGPLAAYNVLSISGPALASFTAYLLCRRLVRHEPAAILAGYLFGFSSYEFAQLTGHLNLTLIFLLPVLVHLALRRASGEISGLAYVGVMAIVLVLQAGLSTELLADSVGMGIVVLASTRLLLPPRERPRVDRLAKETVAAGALALLAASPFFYYALLSGAPPSNPVFWDAYAMDLLNLVVPTDVTYIGHNEVRSIVAKFGGGGVTGQDGYLGIPLLACFLIWSFEARRSIITRVVVIAATFSVVVALGAHLHVAGSTILPLPGSWTERLPIFSGVIPERLSVFTTLAVAIGLAVWLARRTGLVWARWAVAFAAAIVLFPSTPALYFGVRPTNPRFFATTLYKQYLMRGESILILPFGFNDVSMLWQSETGFYFSMPEGYLGQTSPRPFSDDPVVADLLANAAPPSPAFGTFIRVHDVRVVVVDAAAPGPWPASLAQLGLRPYPVGGVILYRVPPVVAAR